MCGYSRFTARSFRKFLVTGKLTHRSDCHCEDDDRREFYRFYFWIFVSIVWEISLINRIWLFLNESPESRDRTPMNRCYHSYLYSSFVNCLVNIKFIQIVEKRIYVIINDSKLLILKYHQNDIAKLNFYLENKFFFSLDSIH